MKLYSSLPNPFVTLAFALVGWVSASIVSAEVREPFRFPINGVIESTAVETYVANARVPFPGVVITSETYVQVTQKPGQAPVVDVFDVHDVGQTAGGDRLLRRIAIDGVISSYEAQTRQRIAAAGFGRVLSSRMPSEPGRVRMDGIISNEELVSRFGLAGVIVSTDSEVQLAFVKQQDTKLPVPEVLEEAVPELLSDPEAIAERMPVFWENAASLLRRFRPTVSTHVRSDNIDFEDGRETSTLVAVAATDLAFDMSQRDWSFGADYNLEKGVYVDGNREDFFNHEVLADVERRLSATHQVSLSGVVRRWRDKRVRQIIEDFNSQLVASHRYRSEGVKAGWQIGSERARLNQELTFEAVNSDTSRTSDNGYDLSQRELGYTAVYRVNRRLTYLVDAYVNELDYVQRLDSEEIALLPGVDAWSSRRLRTLFHAGFGVKRHPETGDSLEEVLWRLSSTWRPRRSMTLSIDSAKEFLEVFERDGELVGGEFGTQQYGKLSWLQRWAPVWQTQMSLTYQQRSFLTRNNDESALQWTLGGQYQANPRLTLSGDGVYTTQHSERSRDYDRWTLTFKADLRL